MPYREPEQRSPIVVCATSEHVIGLHRDTGERVWTLDFEGLGTSLRLAFAGDHVFVGMSRGLACVVERTGEVVWKQATKIAAMTLLLDGDRIVVGGSGRVACFDLHGEELWRDELHGMGLEGLSLGVPGNVANADRG